MSNLIEKLKLSQQDAIKFYPSCSQFEKKFLEQTFGSEIFNVNITDRIKSFNDAICELSCNDNDVLFYKQLLNQRDCPVHLLNYQGVIIITKALNEGWTPNWNDTNERKWYPWFRILSSGLVFDGTYYAYGYTDTSVGSHLCFKNEELSTYAGKQFTEIYKNYLN